MNNKQQKSTEPTPKAEAAFKSGLSPIQEKAAIMLANGESITFVADSLNLNRTTIYQWQQKVTFQCYFNIRKQEATQNLRNGLVALYTEALEAVKAVLKSDNDAIKLKAAMLVIAKVEANPIGETDAKEILRKQATEVHDYGSEEIFKPIEVFDNNKYHQLLEENGFDDDGF